MTGYPASRTVPVSTNVPAGITVTLVDARRDVWSAEIVTCPAWPAVARPVREMVMTLVFDVRQVTVLVTSLVVPLDMDPVAVYCAVSPGVTVDGPSIRMLRSVAGVAAGGLLVGVMDGRVGDSSHEKG